MQVIQNYGLDLKQLAKLSPQNGGDHNSRVAFPTFPWPRLQVDLQAALAIQQDKHLAKWPGPDAQIPWQLQAAECNSCNTHNDGVDVD